MNERWKWTKAFDLLFWILGGSEEGVLDGLMEALNTGKAFRDPSRPQRKRQPRKGKLNNMEMIIVVKVT